MGTSRTPSDYLFDLPADSLGEHCMEHGNTECSDKFNSVAGGTAGKCSSDSQRGTLTPSWDSNRPHVVYLPISWPRVHPCFGDGAFCTANRGGCSRL